MKQKTFKITGHCHSEFTVTVKAKDKTEALMIGHQRLHHHIEKLIKERAFVITYECDEVKKQPVKETNNAP